MTELSEIIARLFAHTPATVFTSLGLALLALASALAYRAFRLMTGMTTGGMIVEWRKRKSKNSVHYAPVVRFHAGSAGEFEVQSQTVFEDQPGLTNEPVTVRYDPANPMRADIEGRHHPWRPVVALTVMAAGAMTVGWQAGGMPESDGSDVAGEMALP